MLEQKFLNPVATIIGGQDDKDRDGNIKMFQTDPNCHILVATMASGGVGLNLQQASYMIYFAKSYSQIEDKQSEARAYRIGSEQHSTIFRYDAIIKRSIEEDIERALNDKKTIVEAMEEWRQTYGRDAKRDLTEYIG
jgi:SNF2 family DNA or RNA helicase